MAESCRKAVRDRILVDMLGGVVDGEGGWKVLILDEFTTRILSSTLRMSDILDCNVSVVEDLSKARQPMKQQAVYFIQPSPKSIARLLDDFGGPTGAGTGGRGAPKQLYTSVHIFFSNKAPGEAVDKLKGNPRLIKALKTLKEINLEFLTVDSRTIVTDHPDAAAMLFSDMCESNRTAVTKGVDAVVSRLVTLFTATKEFPVVRYKAPRPVEPGDPPGQSLRASLPQLLATRLFERLASMQRASQLPGKETCDLLVLDRTYDPVAPFIHEWSYEALVYDIVQLDGNVYRYDTENQAGKKEAREVLLEESDELWTELRHTFIADVYATLSSRFKEFQSKNKAAKALGAGGVKTGEGAMNTSSVRSLIQQLPEFREQLSRLGAHIQLSSELQAKTSARHLTDVGELEQDLVLGEKHSKDMLAHLTEQQSSMEPADKLRLLACYLATHPGKLDVAKRLQWQKTSGLTGEDMAALCGGLARLGVKAMEAAAPAESKSGFFGGKKKPPPKATRKKRGGDEEEEYALNRFQPLLADIVTDMASGRLSAEEYPYIRPPSPESEAAAGAAASARTARSGLNWAKRGAGEGAGGSNSGGAGRRLVVFILGGATRGEMRLAHELSSKLGREVTLGSTSVEAPGRFVDLLYQLAPETASELL